jgi:phage gp45-like
MIDSSVQRYIQTEIKKQLNVILSGQAGPNDSIENEQIDLLYPGSPSIEGRPVMHPCGFASRAPSGTISVTSKQGADAHNRMVLGHRDKMRQSLSLTEGQSCIYASDGKTILSQIKMGSDIDITTMHMTGQISAGGKIKMANDSGELMAALVQLFTDIQNAVTATMLGDQPLIMPTFSTDLSVLQSFKE